MKRDAFSTRHPAVNFLFFVGAIGFGVVLQHPVYVAVGFLCAALYHLLLTGKQGWKLICGMIPLVLFIAIINPLFNKEGTTCLFTLLGNPYTLEALLYGASTGGILAVMFLWFACYNKVLTSDKFISLFGTRIPSLSLLLVMVLRMIPNLQRKAGQILGARRSIGKGASESDSVKDKLRVGMTSISALTDWALEGGIITADSMRARGYGTGRRTGFQLYTLASGDLLLLVLMVALCALTLFAGNTAVSFVPELSIPAPGWGLMAYCAFLLIPPAMAAWDVFQFRRAMNAGFPEEDLL